MCGAQHRQVRVAVVALGLILLTGGCGGHDTLTATGPDGDAQSIGCSAAHLELTQGPRWSEATGQHTLLVEIVAGSGSCLVEGFPVVTLVGATGRELPFTYTHRGDQMLPDLEPHPVTIRPGHPAFVALNKYRCDFHATDGAQVVRLTLPGPTLTLALRLATSYPSLDYCTEAPSLQVAVTPVVASRREIRAPGLYLTYDPSGLAALRDAYDGSIDGTWSCGSLRAAIGRLPVEGLTHSALPGLLDRAAAPACATAIQTIRPGTSRASAVRALGSPDRTGSSCSMWKWAPAGGSIDGVRLCFADGRVASVQTTVHG
jgi:hypothetical protein